MSELVLAVTAAAGTEQVVAAELEALGLGKTKRGPGVVTLVPGGWEAALRAGMKACLNVRAGHRVILSLARFPVRDADELYAGAVAIPWEEHLTSKSTFAIGATTSAPPPLAHAPFLAQRVKDAVVDRMRARRGARPDVNRAAPDVRLSLHIGPSRRPPHLLEATLGLDLAGDPLHLRGYRVTRTTAPLRETLAAAILLASGWTGDAPVVDPMCGSGTIAIEAALQAACIAPGLASPAARVRGYGFEHWPTFGDAAQATWRELIAEAEAEALPRAPFPILARDRDPEAIAAARANVAAAAPAVAASIVFEEADVRSVTPLVPPGVVVSNPPYGSRLGAQDQSLRVFWRMLGAQLRTLHGHTAFLLGPVAMMRALGMRPSWERKLMNGPIPVLLGRFELGRQIPGRRRP